MITRLLLAIIRSYQMISRYTPRVCRFHPTCSHYMHEAIAVHGSGKGFSLGVRRILRCHPWHLGGYDPVPMIGKDHLP